MNLGDEPPGGETLNFEVIGMLVGNFFWGLLLGLFGGKLLPFSKNFPEDPKNTKIRILYPKKYNEHTYLFSTENPPQGVNLLMTLDPESDDVPQITDVSYKTLTEHVTGHFR